MIKKIIFVTILFCIVTVCNAQVADGTYRIKNFTKSDTKIHNNVSLRQSACLTELNDEKTNVGFQIFNFQKKYYEYKECLFMKEGEHCRVFCDAHYIEVCREFIDNIIKTFDFKIYPLITSWFGIPVIPEKLCLQDDKIYIVLAELNGNYSEGYVAGYFDHRDLEFFNGNSKPVLFMDIVKNDPNDTENKNSNFYRTLAHEFQHMVNYSIRKSANFKEQERWLDEGFSMYAEYLYSANVGENDEPMPSLLHLTEFLRNPSLEIANNNEDAWFSEPNLYRQYGASFMFVLYLVEKYGGYTEDMKKLFLKELVRSKSAGKQCITDMLYRKNKDFDNIVFDMNMAISLDDSSIYDGLWGFENKSYSFGTLASLIPLSKETLHNSGEIFILPSGFKQQNELFSNSIYTVCFLEIPVFKNKNLVVIKRN